MHVSLSIPDGDKSAFAEMARALGLIYGADTKRGYKTSRSNSLPGEYGLSVFRGWNNLKTYPHVDQIQRLEGLSRESNLHTTRAAI